MSGFKVNVSQKEAEVRSFEDLPVGKYPMNITDVELAEVANGDNAGKPMYKFEFTVDDPGSKYDGSRAWANAMLWDGALYTVLNILKALGENVEAGEYEIPEADWFVGQKLIVNMKKGKAQVGNGTPQDPQYPARIEPRGFFPYEGAAKAASGKAASLLP